MKQRFFFMKATFVVILSHDHLTVNFNRTIGCEIGPRSQMGAPRRYPMGITIFKGHVALFPLLTCVSRAADFFENHAHQCVDRRP